MPTRAFYKYWHDGGPCPPSVTTRNIHNFPRCPLPEKNPGYATGPNRQILHHLMAKYGNMITGSHAFHKPAGQKLKVGMWEGILGQRHGAKVQLGFHMVKIPSVNQLKQWHVTQDEKDPSFLSHSTKFKSFCTNKGFPLWYKAKLLMVFKRLKILNRNPLTCVHSTCIVILTIIIEHSDNCL